MTSRYVKRLLHNTFHFCKRWLEDVPWHVSTRRLSIEVDPVLFLAERLHKELVSLNVLSDYSTKMILTKEEPYRNYIHSVFNRIQLQRSRTDKVEGGELKKLEETSQVSLDKKLDKNTRVSKYSSNDEDHSDSKWKLELAWLSKALEPALQLCRWALPTGNGNYKIESNPPPSNRSLLEIIASIQRSKVGIQDWSLSDLTIGLYLIYLRQAAGNTCDDIKGIQISSESTVQDLMYYLELAKGAYRDNAASLARNSMLRESNVLKFIKNSSVMRPGYYIGVDTRKKLVILGIRGTHTVYDLITDIVTSSDGEVTFEGYSTHFGTTESARWFLYHEIGTIRKCLEKHEGFRLRLVGHSLGGAIASLLAIMIRKRSSKELGFSPDIVSAVGFGTPPCVSAGLTQSCSGYVMTVVMQDDIVPRLSVASLTRLRNEILHTDWMSVVEKEDWKSFIDLVTNAKQVVSSMQDAARKFADYANFKRNKSATDLAEGLMARWLTSRLFSVATVNLNASIGKELPAAPVTSKAANETSIAMKTKGDKSDVPDELFIPGTVYCLKRNQTEGGKEYFTLLKRHPGEHFQRIILTNNWFSDHKCDSHYYALRDVLKDLPWNGEECIFR
ncbi:Sn1-specific diacylglycerol lipase beta [Senna tora]|uniref:Sn1-specific diacylglycerol lipase beta n=1 Tax=Senna tora TaxID=362788 RepID=A0A834SJB6_9FABA|nr:Sn1-specific diacylglycerol lipase beta [Senna tora]